MFASGFSPKASSQEGVKCAGTISLEKGLGSYIILRLHEVYKFRGLVVIQASTVLI